jgi:hypothetical protein
MDKLAEIRNQELICRERALSDTERTRYRSALLVPDYSHGGGLKTEGLA